MAKNERTIKTNLSFSSFLKENMKKYGFLEFISIAVEKLRLSQIITEDIYSEQSFYMHPSKKES